MNIGKETVAYFRYRLKNDAGNIIEDAMEEAPIAVLYGAGNIIRGLETALKGRSAGDEFTTTIEPVDAYGSRKPDNTQRVSKKYFQQPNRLKPGMQTTLQTKNGQQPVTVVKVGGRVIDVDLNHPLAGERLHFEVVITEVRAATAQEKTHGHAHADGHDH